MATTTPNYGWDVPTSTDYVKDGATAIETLGDDIDATLFSVSGGKNVAMVYLNTYTWSGTNALAIDNIFTSTYDDYKIYVQFSAASAYAGVFANPRVSAADQTSNLTTTFIYSTGSTVASSSGTTNWRIGDVINTGALGCKVELNVSNPMNTSYWTTFTSDAQYVDTTGPSNARLACSGAWRVTTAADGIKLYLSGAITASAKVLVYGIRKV